MSKPLPGDNVGRMTIELLYNGTSRPVPKVTFDPVGMFTAGLIGDHLQYLAGEIERAQRDVRHAERATAKQEA